MTDTPFDPVSGDDLADWITDLVDGHDEEPDAGFESWDLADAAPLDDVPELADLLDVDTVDLDVANGLDIELDRPDVEGADVGVADEAPSITLGDPELDDATGPIDDLPPAGSGDGATSLSALVDAAGALGGAPLEASALESLLDRLGVDDAVFGVEGRAAVQVLAALGVDAHVAHGSVEELADRLQAGEQVEVAGQDGRRHPVVDVDFARGLLVLDADGQRLTVGLSDFADRWSGTAFEMVVAEPVGDGAGDVHVLVPVSVTVEAGGI